MPPLSQIVTYIVFGMRGALCLVKLDIQGFTYFGNNKKNFWRSFLGAGLIAPVFVLYLTLQYLNSAYQGSFLFYLIAQILAYSIAWLTFPLIMLYLAPVLQRRHQMLHYLIAYNWVSVIQNGAYLPVVMLGISGIFPEKITNFLAITVLVWVLSLNLFIARKALKVSFATGAGIVVMDLLLGLLIEVLTNRAQ